MIVFLVESDAAFHKLYRNPDYARELVVCLSDKPILTTGDLHATFPEARERSAARLARAEFTFTDAISSSIRP